MALYVEIYSYKKLGLVATLQSPGNVLHEASQKYHTHALQQTV